MTQADSVHSTPRKNCVQNRRISQETNQARQAQKRTGRLKGQRARSHASQKGAKGQARHQRRLCQDQIPGPQARREGHEGVGRRLAPPRYLGEGRLRVDDHVTREVDRIPCRDGPQPRRRDAGCPHRYGRVSQVGCPDDRVRSDAIGCNRLRRA
jgi:hypothetical protein